MVKLFKNLFLSNRFFWLFGALVGLFALSFGFPILFPIAQALLVAGFIAVVLDCILLFNPSFLVQAKRILPKVFSLGDDNVVRIELDSSFGMTLGCEVIDELPVQFQRRDFAINTRLEPREKQVLTYKLRPTTRGEYHFGDLQVYLSSYLGLIQKRTTIAAEEMVQVYPSVLQMKEMELLAFSRISTYQGIKKIRRIGHSYEFEQIKNYVKGDDYRSINWKATSRRNELMVNQYEDERSQQIFSIIDKSRAMRMPFNGLSLMDYAINTSLVISNVALRKHDKAGLITFSDKIGTTIRAERSPTHLRKIMQALYNEKEQPLDANFELLFRSSQNVIKHRSLIFLYTNFESMYAMERQLPILRKLNARHLLVVVFFTNSEVQDYWKEPSEDLEEVYLRTVAQNAVAEKEQIVYKLRRYGIQSILTRPEDLSINTVNKYLELKSRGMI